MSRPYSNLRRRDRQLDASAMAERAAEVEPLLTEAHAAASWVVRSWRPGSEPREFFAEHRYQSEKHAADEFRRRAETASKFGGAIELVKPCGEVASSYMAAGGGR